MATIYEVSELAGVSLATVSRVINGNARVSEKTREKVESAMATLGYRPNSIAQSLASSRSNSIGLLVSELHGPFFGQMMAGVESELRAAGKHVIITTGHSEEDKEKDGIEFLLSRNCDALILYVEAVSDEYLIELSQGKVPIYLISRHVAALSDKCISLNNELGGYLATKMIIDNGHSSIAYISGPKVKQDACQRLKGHKRALAEHNISFNENLIYVGNYQEESGSDGLAYFLSQKTPFTALICANDGMASGAMTYARENGFELPKDLSVMGFDDVIFARYTSPKLTTMNNPVDDMGMMAARLVLKDIYQQSKKPIQHVFEPEVVLRESMVSLKAN